ncbi:BolA family protein [Acidithiobacillus caldus]
MSKTLLENTLREALVPEVLEVRDRTEAHAGHSGASEGGHYELTVVSRRFEGLSALDRHRLVYDVSARIPHIHALAIRAWTPDEYAQRAARRSTGRSRPVVL